MRMVQDSRESDSCRGENARRKGCSNAVFPSIFCECLRYLGCEEPFVIGGADNGKGRDQGRLRFGILRDVVWIDWSHLDELRWHGSCS